MRMLSAVGYSVQPAVYDPRQGVNVMMCDHTCMPSIEVIWAEGGQTPLSNMLKTRDALVYHLCYSADNVPNALADMAKLGLRITSVGEPKPAVLFGGDLVSFYLVHGFGLIELIHAGSAIR